MLTFSLFLMSYVLNDSKIIEDLYTFVGSLFVENCFVEKKVSIHSTFDITCCLPDFYRLKQLSLYIHPFEHFVFQILIMIHTNNFLINICICCKIILLGEDYIIHAALWNKEVYSMKCNIEHDILKHLKVMTIYIICLITFAWEFFQNLNLIKEIFHSYV